MPRFPYKPYPVKGHPAFSKGEDFHWWPLLSVQLINPRTHAKSTRIEAVVDSGSATCLFHAQVGRAIGLKIEVGKPGDMGGVIAGEKRKIFYHKIKLGYVGNIIDAVAGFSDDLSVAGILGRQSFFDQCNVAFDSMQKPPGMIIERFYRS